MFKKKRDNLVDGAGYFATLQKMEDEQRNNEMHSSKESSLPELTTQIPNK